MKKIYPLLVFLISIYSIQAQIITEGLSHFYPFNGSPDDIEYNNDAIIVGDVELTEDRFGFENCAYSFGGQETSLMLVQGCCGFQVSPDSSFSVSLWYQYGSDDPGDFEHLFYRGWDPTDSVSFGVSLFDLNTPLMYSYNNSLWCDQSLISFPNDSSWHHLAMVFEPNHWKMYFDNQLGAELSGNTANIHFMIADIYFGTSFQGNLDDIAFYNKALNETEITQLYNAPSSCTTGLNDLDLELDINIYPNPSSDVLTIDLKGLEISNFEIINAEGKEVQKGSINSQIINVELNNLSSGLYTIRLLNKEQYLGFKSFIVN